MFDFRNQIALVTGTSSGVGLATAVALARCGATVVCAARREERGREALQRVQAVGGKGDFVKTDISDPDAVDALFTFIRQKYGRLDVACNNAGVEIDHAPVPDLPLQDFDHAIAVNLRGTFMCMKHELRIMRAQRSGAIVNISSLGGLISIKNSSAYCASKFAVVGLTKCAALEAVDFGVRVNVVCPGAVVSEMSSRWTGGDPAIRQALIDGIPMKRMGEPTELADTVMWLLSEHSAYTTGAVLTVDGGSGAGM